MEDFAKVLIVGLFIFALALVVLGQMPSDQVADQKPIDTGIIYSSDSLGDIGFITSRTRSINIGTFSVGYSMDTESAFSEDQAIIENGWFSERSKSVRFSGRDADKAVIEFDVSDMNDYGNLTLSLNGETLYNNITYPRKFVLVAKDLKSDNELLISATSSGPRFWAPATYLLKSLKVNVEKYDDQTKVVAFEIFPYEYDGWGHGTLSFSVDSVSGFANMISAVNGKTIYEGRPLPGDIIERQFTKKEASLIPGENLITFRTDKGVSYDLENAQLVVSYYGSGESNTKVINFDGDRWWKILGESANVTGEIKFFVEKVNLDTGITIYLNDKDYFLAHLKENEWHSIPFSSNDLREKGNEIKFSANGSYRIGKLEVSVVAKEKESSANSQSSQ